VARRKARRKAVTRRKAKRKASSKRKNGSMFSKSWGKISTAIGGLAFAQQVTNSDMHGTENMDVSDKAKVFLNSMTGRIFGVGVVPNLGHPQQTFNFGGIFNKWTGLGAGLWLLAKQPIGIPHKGKAGTLGKALLTSGVIGGFFSPDNSNHDIMTHPHPSQLQNYAFAGGSTLGP